MAGTEAGIHIVGIDEGGMVGVGRIYHRLGLPVSASAARRTPSVAAFEEDTGIAVARQFEAANIGADHLVVRASTLDDDNPELWAARRQGLGILSRSAALARVLGEKRVIAVTGSHGSGTVSAMVTWILHCAGLEPGFAATARLQNFGVEARLEEGKWFVIELGGQGAMATELSCDYAICNFLERELPPGDEEGDELDRVVTRFLESNRRLKEAFVNLDCKGVRGLVERLSLRPTGYALEHRAEYRANLEATPEFGVLFDAFYRDEPVGSFALHMPGAYNAVNALAAIAVARRVGVGEATIVEALKSFRGLENRYAVARGGGVIIVKDLATRPTGMKRVVDGAKQANEGRLIAAFRPPRYGLIKYLKDEYAAVFADCDEVVVCRGEQRDVDAVPGVGSESFVEELRDRGVSATYVASEAEVVGHLIEKLRPGDRLIYFGDDDFLRMADQVQAELAARAERVPADDEQPRLDGPLAEGGEDYD